VFLRYVKKIKNERTQYKNQLIVCFCTLYSVGAIRLLTLIKISPALDLFILV